MQPSTHVDDPADSLLVIPFQVSETQYSVAIILQDSNLERITDHDPVELNVWQFQGQELMCDLQPRDVVVCYATAQEIAEVRRLSAQGEVRDALRLVTRNYRYRPR